jgi:hypothetical protein
MSTHPEWIYRKTALAELKLATCCNYDGQIIKMMILIHNILFICAGGLINLRVLKSLDAWHAQVFAIRSVEYYGSINLVYRQKVFFL